MIQLFFYETKKRVDKGRESRGGEKKGEDSSGFTLYSLSDPNEPINLLQQHSRLVRYKCQRSNSSLSTRLNIQKLINFCCTGVIKAERGGGSIERNLFQAIDIGK